MLVVLMPPTPQVVLTLIVLEVLVLALIVGIPLMVLAILVVFITLELPVLIIFILPLAALPPTVLAVAVPTTPLVMPVVHII